MRKINSLNELRLERELTKQQVEMDMLKLNSKFDELKFSLFDKFLINPFKSLFRKK